MRAQLSDYWLEAECAEIGHRWTKELSDDAAGGAYVETQYVSLDAAPANEPENIIRFTVVDPVLDTPYRLLARVDAPTQTNDSYWLRINDGPWQELNSGFRIGKGFQWVQLAVTELHGGTNTIDFTYRENSTRLDKILLTTDVNFLPTGVGIVTQECPEIMPAPVDKGVFWLEAECAIVGSTWEARLDPAASNGIVLTSTRSTSRFQPPVDLPGNQIRFVIEDPDLSSGDYRIWIRANLPDRDSDAFWLRYNNGPWLLRQPARITGKGLAWAGYSVPGGALQAGTNTIDISYLEAGVTIDKLLLTKYSIVPSFAGGGTDGCPFTPTPVVTDRNTFWLEGECASVGSAWRTESDPRASNNTAVVVRGNSSVDGPPAEDTANLVRFELMDVDSGSYNLFARVNTPTNLSDSYWVRANGGPWYEWASGFSYGAAYQWKQLPIALSLQEGANTVDFAFRESGALLDKVLLTLTAAEPPSDDMVGDPDPGCGGTGPYATYWLEAECAEIGHRWTKELSDDAAGGAYVETQYVSLDAAPTDSPENIVRFTVVDPVLNTPYRLLARVDAPTKTNDSYWLRINDGPWQELNSGFRIGKGFQWVQLAVTELHSGTNTIDFTYRENSTRLDKILLTTDVNFLPTGVGIVTQECPEIMPAPVDKGVFWLEAECAIVGSTWEARLDPAASNGIVLTSTRSTSRFQPPVDLPGNQIRFVIEDPDSSGDYRIWIRANLPDRDSDAFWLRYNNGPWLLRQPARITGKGLAWAGYSVPGGALQAGTNTIDISYLEAGVTIDKLLLTKYSIVPSFAGGGTDGCPFTPTPVVTDRNTFWLEGECASVGSAWQTESDSRASNNTAVVVRGNSSVDGPPAVDTANLVRFELTDVDSGSYNLFARVNTPTNLSDSYWVRANGGPWYEWARGFSYGAAYQWKQLPIALSLQEGPNTVDFAFRESGALLDKVLLTLTAAEPPSDDMVGDPDPGCGDIEPRQPATAFSLATEQGAASNLAQTTFSVFPNPTSSQLTLEWESPFEGQLRATIIDTQGRQVRNIVLWKSGAFLRQKLDVSILPRGVYYLRIGEGDQLSAKRFVKL
ncbi:hypothetical protein GGR28_002500 [Lewinella aquimaris]|uniref:Secretion system C-terminal sorting domain-containing protein n=1 Tax=Neolewinella aquimaris TaxID=1835722 RepID=A0A840E7F4_9BACT|nr:T9SS type A sorting domain-containing protein [Neolewinella aquimaris]MBB4079873.1 hypothetical protein [Neolewinella aquimaris]